MARIVKKSLKRLFVSFIIILLAGEWLFSGSLLFQIIWEKDISGLTPQTAQAASGDIFLFWDGDTDAPTDWTCVSCSAGDTYYQIFPRATSTPGETGGSTHTHTVTLNNVGSASGSGYESGTGVSKPDTTHTHSSISSASAATATATPPYYELKLIKKLNPTSIPAGAIAVFDTTSLPANWEIYTEPNGYIIRTGPAASTTVTGHTHTNVTFTVDANGITPLTVKSGVKDGEALSHTHSFSGGETDPSTQNPPYIDVVLGKAIAEIGSISDGMIAMFDNSSLPTNWAEVTAINNDYFIQASSTGYGTTGGSATHTHVDKAFTVLATANISSKDADVAPAQTGASISHTHSVTVQFAAADNIPPYAGVVFAKYTVPASSVTCTTPLASTAFGTIDNTAIYTSSPDSTTTVTTDSTTGFTMTVYDSGDSASPGLYKSVAISDLIGSADAAYSNTATLQIGIEGFGIQATTGSANINIDPRFWFSSTTNDVGGLEAGSGNAVILASSSAAVTDQLIFITHKATAAITNQPGNYSDTITYTCTVNP